MPAILTPPDMLLDLQPGKHQYINDEMCTHIIKLVMNEGRIKAQVAKDIDSPYSTISTAIQVYQDTGCSIQERREVVLSAAALSIKSILTSSQTFTMINQL